VLFSEPKIPQSARGWASTSRPFRRFQCSSASRKFLNGRVIVHRRRWSRCFSALQRAENSSIWLNHAQPVKTASVSVLFSEPKIPQFTPTPAEPRTMLVSVLFSEPKIPQCGRLARRGHALEVSVLFSEPKIPQSVRADRRWYVIGFQCSSASRKFLNTRFAHLIRAPSTCFSALQRAENSSISYAPSSRAITTPGFSALQRAENSSIEVVRARQVGRAYAVSVLFSEPKIPQSVAPVVW